ncbi:2-oxoacid ferredoxin oxidoreductase [Candidatus Gottesmanbacteria bacterium RIFCSPLOWO2_01_FULL_43_11b]|uniref:2-oxoacid ferredoxin oxidoreductase n=1 Tax=Candidatus Gottesmanbacteria bacterium RIFCSPLOWO2_01_FULL_43_11b TaxID=1798392 RepID=A0A1F6AIV6_9BACT|nr:MAG: 2-oxoacid ferredoxin oxidoreductase [Candidatus Gottesmanbacteria bacterium RIFCSPLOWO2_01_FULL_43_11b]
MSTVTPDSLKTNFLPTWCPGCGDFGIWMALRDALANLRIGSDDGLIVYGIGCHGNMHDWVNMYAIRALHGRTLPVAQGAKLVNHKLPVVIISGDGDCLGEGGNHFIHAAKRNPDLTVFIHNNEVYGLTTGQASPTAQAGFKTKSTPEGAVDEPVNPLTLAIASGATFVARGFAGDMQGLSALMKTAIEHKGFSVVDILQPCVTFDKVHTYQWYRQRVYKLETIPENKIKALEKAMEWGDRIPLGVFYKENKPTSEDRESALADKPLVDLPLTIENLEGLLNEFY